MLISKHEFIEKPKYLAFPGLWCAVYSFLRSSASSLRRLPPVSISVYCLFSLSLHSLSA